MVRGRATDVPTQRHYRQEAHDADHDDGSLKETRSDEAERDAFAGLTRFEDFRASLGIAPNMLTRRLDALVVVPADATNDQVEQAALADEKVKAAIAGKQIVKKVVVPKKLVNIVVR